VAHDADPDEASAVAATATDRLNVLHGQQGSFERGRPLQTKRQSLMNRSFIPILGQRSPSSTHNTRPSRLTPGSVFCSCRLFCGCQGTLAVTVGQKGTACEHTSTALLNPKWQTVRKKVYEMKLIKSFFSLLLSDPFLYILYRAYSQK